MLIDNQLENKIIVIVVFVCTFEINKGLGLWPIGTIEQRFAGYSTVEGLSVLASERKIIGSGPGDSHIDQANSDRGRGRTYTCSLRRMDVRDGACRPVVLLISRLTGRPMALFADTFNANSNATCLDRQLNKGI